MSKKQDMFYFQKFTESVEASCEVAELLKKVFKEYRAENIDAWKKEIHEIEHRADGYKHEVMDVLAKAFIVPIEREDITALCSNIDDVTDKLEDVLLRLYINNVDAIRPDAVDLMDVVARCCSELLELIKEFGDFRHSKTLKKHIIRINELEEEADALYVTNMRRLHVEEKDALKVIAWREIYNYLEKCADACEHAADIVEGVVMKNS